MSNSSSSYITAARSILSSISTCEACRAVKTSAGSDNTDAQRTQRPKDWTPHSTQSYQPPAARSDLLSYPKVAACGPRQAQVNTLNRSNMCTAQCVSTGVAADAGGVPAAFVTFCPLAMFPTTCLLGIVTS